MYLRRLIYFKPILGGGGGGLNRDGGIISLRKDDGISSNNGKEMWKKSVLHVQSCFLLIRPTDFV